MIEKCIRQSEVQGQIDLDTERLLPLAKAARELPGGPVHVGTLYRWFQKGVRGVRLETIMRGGVRFTSWEAIERFFRATTAVAEGAPVSVRTPKQREAAIARAEAELLAA